MAIIKLTKGLETIVDDNDFESLNKHNWYASGLQGRPARRLSVDEGKKLIYIYHQILRIYPWNLRPDHCVDHINGNPRDNTRINLRIVTHAENMRNSARHKNRVGICFDNTWKRWKAYIDRPDRNRKNIGTFRSREEAEEALADALRSLNA